MGERVIGRGGEGERERGGEREKGRKGEKEGEKGRRGEREKGRKGEREKGREGEKGRKGEGREEIEGIINVYLLNIFIFEVSLLKSISMKIIKSHKELDVYELAFKTSMEIFHLTKVFPREEVFLKPKLQKHKYG